MHAPEWAERVSQRTNVPRWATRSAHSGACIQTENGPSRDLRVSTIPSAMRRASPLSSSGDFKVETRAMGYPQFVLRFARGCLHRRARLLADCNVNGRHRNAKDLRVKRSCQCAVQAANGQRSNVGNGLSPMRSGVDVFEAAGYLGMRVGERTDRHDLHSGAQRFIVMKSPRGRSDLAQVENAVAGFPLVSNQRCKDTAP